MLNYYGLITGIFVLILTGIGHIAVIKGEYHFGTKIWPLFLLLGVFCIAFSLSVKNNILSAFLGILGFTSLWGILELFKQKDRVSKGWFPKKR
ncbi:DUF4491 family protein [Clostridium luticellarii]|jgi:hypothetical protein|uniref:DUF4491 domain-containing protein n=1 Tax=Clostridium luticellarii TaxID=1691940 RepID=A0A2T0BA77_9CLOT|nr:DUF4491 family protein [Clostridium luticellarii]MCI1944263.1 DUF4491 family protein [Clostridium luticellarii]MCI1967759.1 DUF4491 family protein [Clostridium luticellarii]MCI1994637.1 DUF4491 family protein [Clostridium luticellarii]MCI2038866.1 DUF4491 family protein [Clostridium luticellarii]PRR80806.1 hypothetical protein CLLU_32890 [Clostridium luticellarii]